MNTVDQRWTRQSRLNMAVCINRHQAHTVFVNVESGLSSHLVMYQHVLGLGSKINWAITSYYTHNGLLIGACLHSAVHTMNFYGVEVIFKHSRLTVKD